MYGIEDEIRCDFPSCGGNFDSRKGQKVAIRKDGKTLAFCGVHATQLRKAGVPLRTLESIHRELNKPEQEAQLRVRKKLENDFIKSLMP